MEDPRDEDVKVTAKQMWGRVSHDAEINTYLHVWRKSSADGEVAKWAPKMVDDIYDRLRNSNFPLQDIKALEFSGFLEKYLWPHVFRDAENKLAEVGDEGVKTKKVLKLGAAVDAVDAATATTDANRNEIQTVATVGFIGFELLAEGRNLARSHVLLIALMFLEKFRDSSDGWTRKKT